MRTQPLIFFVVTVMACGDNAHPSVDLYISGTTLLAYRNGDDPWQQLPLSDDGDYELRVEDDFVVSAVCLNQQNDGFVIVQYALTTEDTEQIHLGNCGFAEQVEREGLLVSGSMRQAGAVFIGAEEAFSEVGPWDYALLVAPGTRTLVATDDTRVRIERGIDVTGDRRLPDIDLTDAPLKKSVALRIPGISDEEEVYNETFLFTNQDDDYAFIAHGELASAQIVPEDLVIAPEYQTVLVSAETRRGNVRRSRGLQQNFREGGLLELMPLLPEDGVVADVGAAGTGVHWQQLPTADYTHVYVDLNFRFSTFIGRASKRWLELHGASAIHLDATVPGFDPSWTINRVGNLYFQVSRELRSELAYTTYTEP
ncbi:MAG: hypothetical protein ABI867_01805 [Kofleriaceae bacterium]